MDVLEKSWSSFSHGVAETYLKGFGHPAETSKTIVADLIRQLSGGGEVSILDVGCGNAQMLQFLKDQGIKCHYTGVDFSLPLLKVAMRNFPDSEFLCDNIETLLSLKGTYDIALYSHVIELLSSPEEALLAARKVARKIMIRFYEPPEFEVDRVELKEMDIGAETKVPYLRRKMSRDYYRLVLYKIGCRKVEIYKDTASKDQVHLLHFDRV